MIVKFKKEVLDLKKNQYFPLGEEVYLDNTRFENIRNSVKRFGMEEEYFEIVEQKKSSTKEKGYNDDAEIVEI